MALPTWLGISIFIIVELIVSLLGIYFIRKFYKNKDYYPIKQLSPLITLLLGVSFYFCQLALFSMIIFFNEDEMKLNKDIAKCTDENGNENVNAKITFNLMSLLYIFSRGFCYAFTVVKSYRVLVGFQRNKIQANSWQLIIFKQELYLLIFATLYAVLGFPVVTIITTSFYDLNSACWLEVYETNFGGVKYNSWIEEIIMLFVIFLVNPCRMNDRLVKLTIHLQVLYVVWFSINSLIAQYTQDTLFVQISCWIRSIVMFYGYIYYPWKLKEQHPTLYITTEQISSLEAIIEKKFKAFYTTSNYCSAQFYKFLQYLDKQNYPIVLENERRIQSMNNFDFFDLFEKLEDLLDRGQSNDQFFILISSNEEIKNIFKDQDPTNVKETILNYFKDLYQKKFKKTKAFDQLIKFYDSNITIQHNFELLDMKINQAIMPKFNQGRQGTE